MSNETMNEVSGYRVGEIHPTAHATVVPIIDTMALADGVCADDLPAEPDRATVLAQKIRAVLGAAAEYDSLALMNRRVAGRLLAELRSHNSVGSSWYRCVELDQRSADLLIELGCAARPVGHQR